MSVVKTCEKLIEKIKIVGAQYIDSKVEDVEFDGKRVYDLENKKEISMKDLTNKVLCNNNNILYASESYSSKVSPPPYMVGIAEVEVDKETEKVELINYKAVVDCRTVEVDFESSYEPSGPFGIKSIGEVVINTSSPAIANAVGVRIRELPITPEKVYMGMKKL